MVYSTVYTISIVESFDRTALFYSLPSDVFVCLTALFYFSPCLAMCLSVCFFLFPEEQGGVMTGFLYVVLAVLELAL